MPSVSNLRKGLIIKFDNSIYEVVEFLHVNPGKGQAFVRTNLRNLEAGSTIKQTFKKGDSFKILKLEERDSQYLYRDDNNFYFMDMETFEQYIIGKEIISDGSDYLKEGMECKVRITERRPIGISLPIFVSLKVETTEPGVRGNTAQGGTKPAKLETGATVKVPLFIEEGEEIIIDTRTGEYSERK